MWRALSPKAIFSRIVSQGNKFACWNAKPLSLPGFVTEVPSTNTLPPVGFSRPAMQRKRVDFPQPEGPIRLTKLPGFMFKEIPFSATTSPAASFFEP